MSRPSDRAVEAMREAYDAASVGPSTTWELLGEALEAAHDPALGLDRSVCLRDVVEALVRFQGTDSRHHYLDPSGFIEREFGGSGV